VVAVNVEMHVAEAVVPANVHVVKLPVTPVWPRDTVPVGVVAPIADVSVTVTLQVDPWLITTGLEQATVVVVGWAVTPAVTIIDRVVLVELPPVLSWTIREAVNVVVVVTV
jgi:hypothetical protein